MLTANGSEDNSLQAMFELSCPSERCLLTGWKDTLGWGRLKAFCAWDLLMAMGADSNDDRGNAVPPGDKEPITIPGAFCDNGEGGGAAHPSDGPRCQERGVGRECQVRWGGPIWEVPAPGALLDGAPLGPGGLCNQGQRHGRRKGVQGEVRGEPDDAFATIGPNSFFPPLLFDTPPHLSGGIYPLLLFTRGSSCAFFINFTFPIPPPAYTQSSWSEISFVVSNSVLVLQSRDSASANATANPPGAGGEKAWKTPSSFVQ
jgi:hypothetical protein